MNALVKRFCYAAWLRAVLFAMVSMGFFAQGQTPEVEKPEMVSLIKLVADSRSSNRKIVAVGGYLKVTAGYALLYVSSEHAKAGDIPSAILLELEGEKKQLASMMSDNWVRVIGKFEHNLPSADAPYSGKITSIKELTQI